MNRILPVTKNLIIANIAVFIIQFWVNFTFEPGLAEDLGALWTWQSGNFKIWQMVTHMFMHANLPHIAFNMFALYMFGPFLEGIWGPKRFFQFYITCGLASAVCLNLLSTSYGYAVGASGAVTGVLAAFAYIYPNMELYLMFIPIPIKAKYLIPGFIAIDLFSGISGAQDGIAHFGHLGGALAGFLMVYIWRRTDKRRY